MARGTGLDNRTTAWSVNAIEQRGLLSRGLAVKAVNALIASGAVAQTAKGRRATRHDLLPAADIPALKLRREALTPAEAEAVEKVRNGRRAGWQASDAADKG